MNPTTPEREAVAAAVRQAIARRMQAETCPVRSFDIKYRWSERDAAVGEATDKILAILARGCPEGWRPIEEHDNSRDPFIVDDKHGRSVVAWRDHPSSRTDQWLTIPGGWQVTPTRFAQLPAAPQPSGGE